MTLSATLVAAGTATTNPAPNTLGTSAPATYANGRYTPSAAWLTQSQTKSPALFPLDLRDGSGDKPIQIGFNPSGGAAVTYTVDVWQWCRLSSTWIQPKDNASFSMTGAVTKFLEYPGADPWFIQLSSISTGTVAIYYDGALARAQ